MAAAYQLTTFGVRRTVDNAFIPNDVNNTDWIAYQSWLALGNIPDPIAPSVRVVAAPCSKVHLHNQQTIANTTFTRILFDTVDFDSNGWWDPINRCFKPNVAGYYRFTYSGYLGYTVGMQRGFLLLSLNGTGNGIGYSSDLPGGAYGSVGSTLIHLDGVTQFVECDAYIAGTTCIVGSPTDTSGLTNFECELVHRD